MTFAGLPEPASLRASGSVANICLVNSLNPGVSVISLTVVGDNSLSKDYPHSDDHAKERNHCLPFI